jgi:hypothetical protein
MDWLDENRLHAQWDDAYRAVNELGNEAKSLVINLRSLDRAIWNQCCTLYAALYHADQNTWMDEYRIYDVSSPQVIWEQVMPGRDAPGSWPEDPKEKYVERSVHDASWQARKEARR